MKSQSAQAEEKINKKNELLYAFVRPTSKQWYRSGNMFPKCPPPREKGRKSNMSPSCSSHFTSSSSPALEAVHVVSRLAAEILRRLLMLLLLVHTEALRLAHAHAADHAAHVRV
jgi:hypothetical protein